MQRQAGGFIGALAGAHGGVKLLPFIAIPLGTAGAALLGGAALQTVVPVTVRNRPLTPAEQAEKRQEKANEKAAEARQRSVAGTSQDPKMQETLNLAAAVKFLNTIRYDADKQGEQYRNVLADNLVREKIVIARYSEAVEKLMDAGMSASQAGDAAYNTLSADD